MTKEFGIFNDEGLLEGDFYSEEEAEEALQDRYNHEDDAYVAEVCSEHREQPADNCEECDKEECEHPNAESDDEETYHCPDCGINFIPE